MKGVDNVMMKTRRMKVVFVETGQQPQVKTVSSELCDLQCLFADEVKVHYPTRDSIALIYDRCETSVSEDGESLLCVSGNLIVCGVGKNKFCSLTLRQQEKYLKLFSNINNSKISWRADTQKGK